MDFTEYSLAFLANERLAVAREASARRARLASLTPREPLRVRVGAALIALGQRLLGDPTRRAPLPAPQRVAP
ncbi:MAG TPA: hypothetical protein VGT02_19665 [Methylomirabilota bacterium]|nr:hypothetical protein [Methylomirabilota bacterium]